jgi:glycosyltransferase involved in cell wall biosynthesis
MAQALVFASLYEGFGLPVLEAMACGTPVIASNSTSIPEVGADSILYVDPYSVASISQGMYRLLNDPELQKDLSNKGLARAQVFSWERTIARVSQVFSNCLDE